MLQIRIIKTWVILSVKTYLKNSWLLDTAVIQNKAQWERAGQEITRLWVSKVLWSSWLPPLTSGINSREGAEKGRAPRACIIYESFRFPTDKALDHLTVPKKKQSLQMKYHKLSISQIKRKKVMDMGAPLEFSAAFGDWLFSLECPMSKCGH